MKLKKTLAWILAYAFVLAMLPATAMADTATPWNGSSDISWYDASKTEFTITTAEQFAGISALSYNGVDFAGKTIKLGADIDLNGTSENWEPIDIFKGVLDGQGHTISNMRILTKEVVSASKAYYSMFREVQGATFTDLKIDGARLLAEGSASLYYGREMSPLVGMTYGDCLFRDITVTNSFAETYNNSVAGLVAEAYDGTVTFDGVIIDATNTVSSLWASYDTRVGGVLSYLGSGADAVFEDCIISPVLDVYNDANSNYQYYVYRRAGMLVGEIDGSSDNRVTVTDCDVCFDFWNQYVYCEWEANGRGSYAAPGEWKCTRYSANEDISDHVHDTDESHGMILAFEQLIGTGTGGTPIEIMNGVTKKEEPYYADENGPGIGGGEEPIPETGDGMELFVFAGVALAAALGLAIVSRKKEWN